MIYKFFESIRLCNGQFGNLPLHEERMARTLQFCGEESVYPDLNLYLDGFDVPQKGLYKCRISYSPGIAPPEFLPYQLKPIKSLRLVEAADCSYAHKFADRSCINKLLEQRQDCDDILITRNGFLSDTSYCNIILRDKQGKWITPSTPLLPGTQRQSILMQGLAEEREVHIADLKEYNLFKLVNAMITWEEAPQIPIRNIINSHIG